MPIEMKKTVFAYLLLLLAGFGQNVMAQNEPDADDKELIFTILEVEPEFPGGYAALYQFIAQNLRYPDSARVHGLEGRVVVEFVVDSTGEILNPRIVEDIGGGCGDEVLRVVGLMPRWKPGRASRRGKPVAASFTLPVRFGLAD